MNIRLLRSFSFSLTLALLPLSGKAQETDINANALASYNHAIKLYNSKAYAAAQISFKEAATQANSTQNLKADADYYNAMCAIRLAQTDADELVLNFVKEHPNSNKKEKAFLNVGNYYFANKKAAHSLKWYSKVNDKLLSVEDKQELNFKMGYALLVTGNMTLAKKRFLPLINSPRYGDKSRYYYGYIAYKQEDYDTAEATLKEIADEEAYKAEVTYYLLDISFKAGRFEKCIEIGKKLLPKAKRKEKSEISKIIGESYFNLKNYKEAIPFLKVYRGKRGKWNNTDYYQLGYAYYKQNDFENAVNNFNKIIDQKNAVSQNAYYHLGECYLNLEKKPEALHAFKSASEMHFSAKIKEDAALNYAKLSYEEGNPYKSVAEVLQDFLKAYPKSPNYQEINQLVVTSYLHQQDYQGALDYLTRNKSKENEALYKEVAFYRGVQLFNDNKLSEALPFFTTATLSGDSVIKPQALYWKGETNYRLNDFKAALDDFLQFDNDVNSKNTTEKEQVKYNIAYTYFKLKDYTQAATYFTNFLSKEHEDGTVVDDANVRLGDCYFASKKYTQAIKAYDKVIDNLGTGADYAQYQKGMSFGFLEKNAQKITELQKVISDFETTNLKDDALFQLAATYTATKQNDKAHDTYKQLQKEYKKSSYIPKSLLRQGLLYYNDNENDKAIAAYKKVVAAYPNTIEAQQAVSNAKRVYVDAGNVDEYATWVKTLSFVDVTDAELDNTMYEAAENKFLEGNTTKAVSGFQKYIKRFPQGIHALKANFHLGQLLFKQKSTEESIPHYTYVIEQPQNEFSEEALNKLSQIYLEQSAWEKAIPLLERLEQEANYKQNIIYAQRNLMKGYYQSEAYEKAVNYAEKVLLHDKLEAAIEFDAKIIIARAAFKTEDYERAEDFYSGVELNATGALKAEALYYNAYFKHQNKAYKASNKVVQDLIANYSSYKYWGVKSYIIMAKNYYKLKDSYQATYILENIIKNFTQFEDIIAEAQKELKDIKAKEAKTNDSVTPQK